MKARVYVSMKPTVLDPQGQTIRSALAGLGHTSIAAVRQGKFFDIDSVYALRPLYLTADGEVSSEEHGLFRDRRTPKKVFKTRVVRTVRVQARPGYAVGGITVRSGLNINGLSLTFMKINGRTSFQKTFLSLRYHFSGHPMTSLVVIGSSCPTPSQTLSSATLRLLP